MTAAIHRLFEQPWPEGEFHQVSTLSRDYDAKLAHYLDQNYELACGLTNVGQRVAFIDTFADFGFSTEIVEDKASFRTHLATIARTCETWDGSDPIRILTRAGYRTPDEPYLRKDENQ